MPVIGMDEIGNPGPAWPVGKASGDMIEERKAKRIVWPLFPGFSLVKAPRPAVEGRAIHQPHRHFGLRQTGLEEPNFAATQRIAEMEDLLRV